MKINIKNKKFITSSIAFGIILTNMSMYSFANEFVIKQTKGTVNTWVTELKNMPTKRAYLTSSTVDDKIYCIGGWTLGDNPKFKTAVEVYNPKTDSWETKSSMITARSDLTSSVVDGKIYCIGGNNGSMLNTVEVYDPETDSWETKTSMPTARYSLTSAVVDGKIYCIGGCGNSYYLNKVEIYDPATDSWTTGADMPTGRNVLSSAVVDSKIYCIGGSNGSGYLSQVEVYDPKTDSWETKASMPSRRGYIESAVVDDKIYCIGGMNGSPLSKVEVYDPIKNSWETKANMPTSRIGLTSGVVDGKIYCIGGVAISTFYNKVEAYIAPRVSLEEKATLAVEKAEASRKPEDIENARDLVNQLPESEKKEELQDRLDTIIPNLELERKNYTTNLDVYIKSENSLHMALSTNHITFEDYSGVKDLEKQGAINITINSSLPYQLNAYMLDEMYNSDKSQKIDIDRLNIKDNLNATDTNYKEFTSINTKLVLNDSCADGNGIKHTIDLKLNGDEAYPADIYKTTIKFEAEQK